MNFDELKAAWKCQDTGELSKLIPEKQLAQLRIEHKRLDFVLLATDIFVAIVLISCTMFFLSSMREQEINWPLYAGSTLILAAAAFHPWRNHQRRKREKRYGDSLRDELMKKRAQLDFQIRYSRWSSLWGYYLPIITGLCLLYWQSHLNGRMTLVQFHKTALFHIVALGLLGYFAGGLGIGSARKQLREVDQELDALDCPLTDEELPALHKANRFLLVGGALAVCGYLLFSILNPRPRDGSPIQPAAGPGGEIRFAKVAPYTGVRWDGDSDQPIVRIAGEWLRLTAVEGIPIEELMQVARQDFGDLARKRFTEDLPELLHAAGHNPAWTVTLMLDRGDGKGAAAFEVEMTEGKRTKARNFTE